MKRTAIFAFFLVLFCGVTAFGSGPELFFFNKASTGGSGFSDTLTGSGAALASPWAATSTSTSLSNCLREATGLQIAAYSEAILYYSAATSNIAQVTYAYTAATNPIDAGPSLSNTSSGSGGYYIQLGGQSGGNWTSLSLMKNGSWVNDFTTSGTWSDTATHVMRIVANYANYPTSVTITASIDGVQVGSAYTDSSTPLALGYPGIFANMGPYEPATILVTNFQDY